jgi:UMF1 family MFS transporter
MTLVLPFVTGEVFGLDVPGMSGGGKAAAFVPTAVMFALFAIPVFLWVRERPGAMTGRPRIGAAYRQVWQTIRDTRRYPGALRFLIADYFFEDAVATVIINIGIYCSVVLHMADEQITGFLIISTVSAVIGSFLIGLLARRVALKPLLAAIAIVWIICLTAFVIIDDMTLVWILGSVVGVVLGGLWTVTRPMLAELVPAGELGRFFGLFSLSGRAAAVIGPLIWTAVVYLFHPDRALGQWLGQLVGVPEPTLELSYKLAVLSLAVMMVIGLFVLRRVPRPRGDVDA